MNLPLLFAQATSNCTLNGQPVSCDELADKAAPFLGAGLIFFAVLAIIALIGFVFWVLMLMHAIKHNSPNKQTWIIILVVSFVFGFSFIAAVVYYFVEKKKAEQFTNNGQNGPSQPGPQGPPAQQAPIQPEQPTDKPVTSVQPDNQNNNQPPQQ